jgi:predicted TIM-barrel fold metal-dependent hydrolase
MPAASKQGRRAGLPSPSDRLGFIETGGAMLDFKLFSCDSHIVEHPDAFVRVQREFGDRAPRVVENPEGVGKGLWLIKPDGGLDPMQVGYFALGHVVEKPHGRKDMLVYRDSDAFKKTVTEFRENYRYEDNKQDWEPAAYLEALERDGVEGSLLYASWTRYNYHETDAKLQRAIFRSYNEWMLEFVSHARKRLFFAPLISILDVDLAAADMTDYVKRGCKTVQIPTTIIGSGYYEEQYEKLWATAADLGIPLSVHSSSSQGKQMKRHALKTRDYDPRKYIIRGDFNPIGGPATAWEFMSNLIFSGVFDRYPSLKVVAAEFQVSDAAAAYESVDYRVGRAATYDSDRNVNRRWPSEYLLENCYFGFEDSRATVLTAPFYGQDNFLWANDYPHFQTPWPHSRTVFQENCDGLDPAIRRKLGRDNMMRVYGLA